MNTKLSGPNTPNRVSGTAIDLPSGGGSIRGLGETFKPNVFSGTAGYTLPLFVTPARGFEPQLALSYQSGAGNGLFGTGFSVGLPKISRRTEKLFPRYDDTDVFLLSGNELITAEDGPVGNKDGWTVKGYKHRFEGSFDRVEYWSNSTTAEAWWKVISRTNDVHIYGKSASCRIASPGDPCQVFEWLLEESVDSKGNRIVYTYSPDPGFSNSHIQSIRYGNYMNGKTEEFAFELLFDYGERVLDDQELVKTTGDPYTVKRPWTERQDAFSSFRSGFAIRTARLCRHILMFHHFKELGTRPHLVRKTSFIYDESPALSLLTGVNVTGYRRSVNGSYELQKMPPVEFSFSAFKPETPAFKEMTIGDTGHPMELDDAQIIPIDLYREGIEGFVFSHDDAVFYLEPLGEGNYAQATLLKQFPAHANLHDGSAFFTDTEGNGRLDLQVRDDEHDAHGFYQGDASSWQNYRSFNHYPNTLIPSYLESVSLCGNGRTDLMVVGDDELTCYFSLGAEGYAAPFCAGKPAGFPSVKKEDPQELVTFSALMGDGIQHRVRISNGVVECWPNLGYGRFGQKISFTNAPDFGPGFKVSRLFLSDIDGSGTADLIYVHDDHVDLYLNQSGNSFSNAVTVSLPEGYTDNDHIRFADISGNGTNCLVFSKSGVKVCHYFVEFTGNTPYTDGTRETLKPYLLTSIRNNLGALTELHYSTSTKFMLADKKAGKKWQSQLPFPVQVVEKEVHTDEVSGNRLTTLRSYHEGYYDAIEREFCGFGYIESWDTETFDLAPEAAELAGMHYVPPVYTRTWFHTGSYITKEAFTMTGKYDGDPTAAPQLAPVVHELIEKADPDTWRQAHFALRGSMIRSETYGLDDLPEAVYPYSVSANCMEVRLEPSGEKERAAFLVVPRENISYHYERNPDDPRVQQEFFCADRFGNILDTYSVSLPRRNRGLSDAVHWPEQLECRIIQHSTTYFNQESSFRLIGVPVESKTAELREVSSSGAYYLFSDLVSPEPHTSTLQGWSRSWFWNDDLSATLPAKQVAAKGLLHHTESVVFDAGLSSSVNNGLTDEVIGLQGGYFTDAGYWWAAGNVQVYESDPARFYLLSQEKNTVDDPTSSLNTLTTVSHDAPYYFRQLKTSRVLDKKTSLIQSALIDYVTMQPKQVTDCNLNISQALFDPLGNVIVTSSYEGKGTKKQGGANLYPATKTTAGAYQQRAVPDAVMLLKDPAYYLQGATGFYFYDFFAWYDSRNNEYPLPVSCITLQRDNFYYVAGKTTPCTFKISITHFDGYHRDIDTKTQTENGADKTDRWITSGRTLYNNKGWPCEKYESYFTSSPAYDRDPFSATKIPPAQLCYDPLGRAIRTVSPKGLYTEVRFDPWASSSFDENDTLLDSPYYRSVSSGPISPEDAEAIAKAVKFYHTPQTAVVDPMGNTIRTISDNLGVVTPDAFEALLSKVTLSSANLWKELCDKGYLKEEPLAGGALLQPKFSPYTPGFRLDIDDRYSIVLQQVSDFLRQGCLTTFHRYDIQGRELLTADPRLYYTNVTKNTGLFNLRMHYGVSGNEPYLMESADGGTQFHLKNKFGGLIWSLSARNFRQTIRYDSLQRRREVQVIGCKDDGTIATDNLVEVYTYGESQSKPETNNLMGRLYELRDQSGIVTFPKYTLHGEALSSSRRFAKEYKSALNWAVAVPLAADAFITSLVYDACGRITSETTPDGNVTSRTYNKAGLPDMLAVKNDGKLIANVITHTEYDARNLRTSVNYGNGITTAYTYEDTTHHLIRLLTTRTLKSGSATRFETLQDIVYTHDPHGNITRKVDQSLATVFNSNQQVDPICKYTYDPLYHLVEAEGRQHPAATLDIMQNSWPLDDLKQSRSIPLLNDAVKLEKYTQKYTYDEAGNLVKTVHLASNRWTRETPVTTDSNRLGGVDDGTGASAVMLYDRSGNQKQLTANGSVELTWSCCENLVKAGIIHREGEPDDADYYTYDSHEMRTRKVSERLSNKGSVTEAEEKVYLGNYEEKVITTIGTKSTVIFRRKTLRVMDGQHCAAIIHYWAQDTKKREVDKRYTRKLRYQLTDHLGSSALEVDEKAKVISYEEYFPYGETSFITGDNQKEIKLKEYRYSGKERDDSTGLYYYGARYYAPWLGRWLSPDPAGPIDGLNLYAFVGGNPVNKVDVHGLSAAAPSPNSHAGLTNRGYALGFAIGKRILNTSQAKINADEKSLDELNKGIKDVKTKNGIPLQNDASVEKAVEKMGDGTGGEAQFRYADKRSDEFHSTAATRDLNHGIFNGMGKAASDVPFHLTAFLSELRLPTNISGYSTNEDGSMQHPTRKKIFSSSLEGHYDADLERRQAVVETGEAALAAGHSAHEIIRQMGQRAIEYTLNYFTMPLSAGNANLPASLSGTERLQHTHHRDVYKVIFQMIGGSQNPVHDAGTQASNSKWHPADTGQPVHAGVAQRRPSFSRTTVHS